MPWEREPSWLYLPHIISEDRTRPMRASDGTAKRRRRNEGAVGDVGDTGIDVEPAAAAGDEAQHVVGNRATLRTTRREEAWERAEERLAARNLHLKRSLDDHAERVEKRRRLGLQEDVHRPSATERLAAIRRRLADRRGAASAEGNRRLELTSSTSSRSNEDDKIHYPNEDVVQSDDPAEGTREGQPAGASNAGGGGAVGSLASGATPQHRIVDSTGAAPVHDAAAHAASWCAWHSGRPSTRTGHDSGGLS